MQQHSRVPSGNCNYGFFVDIVTLYDASSKNLAERGEIVDLTNHIVNEARKIQGLGVDFSGTHSQPDDVDLTAVASEIFGSEIMAASVQKLKKTMDPHNRFRFHPFAKFIA